MRLDYILCGQKMILYSPNMVFTMKIFGMKLFFLLRANSIYIQKKTMDVIGSCMIRYIGVR